MIFPATRRSGTREDVPSLQRLQALLGKPEEAWGWPRREVWEASEQHLGVTLPADYKAFMDVYGPGTLGEYLHLDRPTGLMTPVELEDFWSLEAWLDARKGWEDLYPFPFHPTLVGSPAGATTSTAASTTSWPTTRTRTTGRSWSVASAPSGTAPAAASPTS
ncbi:SMI1/KNR4 family protein [Streptomyces erythrochromogenes]|uniref:SMI1/KNR4 family protein n=1 Tax=Streptomyces erythrochromogenes TaxID=285574 RepID=UPI0038277A43